MKDLKCFFPLITFSFTLLNKQKACSIREILFYLGFRQQNATSASKDKAFLKWLL